MRWDNLSGRRERRLPIVVAVRLEGVDCESANENEKTYTDNLSAHGVRVNSAHVWHPGEHVEVTPLNEACPVRGEVIYCQRVDDTRFFVGLKLPYKRLPWRALERYDSSSAKKS